MNVDTAIVLAGGKGTRIRSLFPDIPKALIPIANKPFVLWQVEYLIFQGVREIVLSIGHLGEEIEAFFRTHPVDTVRLNILRECIPLGTGGAIRFISQRLKVDYAFVCNGDSFCPAPLSLLEEVITRTHCDAVILLSHVDDVSDFGTIETDPEGNIVCFVEKGKSGGEGWVSAGIYCLKVRWMRSLPARIPLSIEKDIFPYMPQGHLRAVKTTLPFLDIGVPERLMAAEDFLARHSLRAEQDPSD